MSAEHPEGVAAYFRDGELPQDALRWWQLERQAPLLGALNALCHGGPDIVRLRTWVFLELMTLPEAKLSREALNQHFHLLTEAGLELVLRRLRDHDLLDWQASATVYRVTPLAHQLMAMLAPLNATPSDDADLGALLASVAGAHQLGELEPAQLQHLQARLAGLYEEFADAIASGSEFELRRAQSRFKKALQLVDRASDALSALIRAAQDRDDAQLERLARDLGAAQARLMAMAGQFQRSLQQADRQRVTLGSTGVTSSDVRRWLAQLADPAALLDGALAAPLAPVFVSPHELLDAAEVEFERERASAAGPQVLPPAQAAPDGNLAQLTYPAELQALCASLLDWAQQGDSAHPLGDAVLGGRWAQTAYRLQLLPLLGDPQSAALGGASGELARSPWRLQAEARAEALVDPEVARLSIGQLIREKT